MNWKIKAGLLLFFFALCGAAVIGTHMAEKRTPAPAARELYSVVSRQLSALRADDFDDAYRQAASGVQQKFSRAQFELMIRQDYAAMQKASKVEFGEVRVEGASALVQVYLVAKDGAIRGYLYSFSAESGTWKIDGVQPLGPQPARRARGLHI